MMMPTSTLTREGCAPETIDLIERIQAAPRHVLIISHPGTFAFAAIRRVCAEQPRVTGAAERWERAVILWWMNRGRTLDEINAERAARLGGPVPPLAHWTAPEWLTDAAPVRMPHHTVSASGMIGHRSSTQPYPGEFSAAHGGILVMDEYPEFSGVVRECLREPLDTGAIDVIRARYQATLPARFKLIARSNPCACGYFNHPDRACVCSPGQRRRYCEPWGMLTRRTDVTVIDLCGARGDDPPGTVATYTTAPADYDGFGTAGVDVGTMAGRTVRRVVTPAEHYGWQRDRYRSGGIYLVTDREGWDERVASGVASEGVSS